MMFKLSGKTFILGIFFLLHNPNLGVSLCPPDFRLLAERLLESHPDLLTKVKEISKEMEAVLMKPINRMNDVFLLVLEQYGVLFSDLIQDSTKRAEVIELLSKNKWDRSQFQLPTDFHERIEALSEFRKHNLAKYIQSYYPTGSQDLNYHMKLSEVVNNVKLFLDQEWTTLRTTAITDQERIDALLSYEAFKQETAYVSNPDGLLNIFNQTAVYGLLHRFDQAVPDALLNIFKQAVFDGSNYVVIQSNDDLHFKISPGDILHHPYIGLHQDVVYAGKISFNKDAQITYIDLWSGSYMLPRFESILITIRQLSDSEDPLLAKELYSVTKAWDLAYLKTMMTEKFGFIFTQDAEIHVRFNQ